MIKTNTFGANRLKFAGTDIKTAEVVAAGVKNAKKPVLLLKNFVALDLGPRKTACSLWDLPLKKQ